MESLKYRQYLKTKRRYNILIRITQLLLLGFIIGIWQILANMEIINTFITSSPSKIFNTIINLIKSNSLFHHVGITLYETLISFILGTVIGIIIAIILWFNKFIARVIDPYLTIINSLPKVSLGPIIIIWAGANIKSVIIMALLMEIIITIITVYNGFKSTDKNKINLLRSMGANRYQMLKYLVLPNSYPTIISSLKINISMSLIGVIMGELLVSKEGIGYLIMYGSQVFNLSLVLSGIVILLILSYIMYLVISYIEKILIYRD